MNITVAFVTVTLSTLFLVLFCLLLRFRRREFQHKERMAALEKGAPLTALPDAETQAPWTPRAYLLRGMMWLFSGLALWMCLAAVATTSNRPRSLEDRLFQAQRLKTLGATEAQIRQAETDTYPREGMSPGVSLIALAPIGVGLAYLIFYRVERKNLPPRRPEA